MRNYRAQKQAQFDASEPEPVVIRAVALALTDEDISIPGFHPVNPCVCVTEPCPCDGYDHGNSVFWISSDVFAAQKDSGTLTEAGEKILEFALDPNATVMVECVQRLSARDAIKALGSE